MADLDATAPATLLQHADGLLVDLDGVVYVGPHPVPGAAEGLADAREAGLGVAFVTNNASRTAQDVAEHLRSIGVAAQAHDVVTSSQAAAGLVAERCGPGARVLAVGGPGVAAALREAGLDPVTSAEPAPAAVVQGYGDGVGWAELAEATYAVRAGALWVATNADVTLPTPRGPAPGNGALVAAVAAALGREPDVVAGKPEPPQLHAAAVRIGAERPLMVGDRLDTDVTGAARAGLESLLVLTGVTSALDLLRAEGEARPTYVVADLHDLSRPYQEARREGSAWVCGPARAEVVDGRLDLSAADPAVLALRAAAAAVWAAADDGHEVDPDGLADVAARLSAGLPDGGL